jgi:hypothetical protein
MKKFVVIVIFHLISIHLFGQKVGIEFSYLGSSNTIDLPGLLTSTFEKVESGGGSNLSFGLTVKASDDILIRGGLCFISLPFRPTIKGTINNQPAFAKEDGNLNYSGIYLRVDRTWPYFYLTGGFDISFGNSYKSTLETRNASGTLLSRIDNGSKSILTNSFYNQFNLVLGLGPSIPIGKSLTLKGVIAGVVPFSAIYDSGLSVPQVYISTGAPAPNAKVNLRYLPFITYGINLEYKFGKKS